MADLAIQLQALGKVLNGCGRVALPERNVSEAALWIGQPVHLMDFAEEGRGLFSNIKKYLMYLLSSNIGEIGLMTAATLAGMPLPLTAVQILYVNLATDGLPALALAVDPPEKDLMRRKPRNPRAGIFTRPVVLLVSLTFFFLFLTLRVVESRRWK